MFLLIGNEPDSFWAEDWGGMLAALFSLSISELTGCIATENAIKGPNTRESLRISLFGREIGKFVNKYV